MTREISGALSAHLTANRSFNIFEPNLFKKITYLTLFPVKAQLPTYPHFLWRMKQIANTINQCHGVGIKRSKTSETDEYSYRNMVPLASHLFRLYPLFIFYLQRCCHSFTLFSASSFFSNWLFIKYSLFYFSVFIFQFSF